MMYNISCIMDAGWGREPSTIKNHLLKVNKNVIKCKDIEKAPSYPVLGLRPVKDLMGMEVAVEMLMWCLDLGRLSAFT